MTRGQVNQKQWNRNCPPVFFKRKKVYNFSKYGNIQRMSYEDDSRLGQMGAIFVG